MKKEHDLSEAKVDALLQETEHLQEVVRALPEDGLSLSWRSELNEKLLASQPVRRRGPWFAWKPVAGLVCAAALAMMFIMPRSPEPGAATPSGSFEAKLLVEHAQSSRSRELVDVGLTAVEAKRSSERSADLTDWNPSDLESL